jgi:hypothetical protein
MVDVRELRAIGVGFRKLSRERDLHSEGSSTPVDCHVMHLYLPSFSTQLTIIITISWQTLES